MWLPISKQLKSKNDKWVKYFSSINTLNVEVNPVFSNPQSLIFNLSKLIVNFNNSDNNLPPSSFNELSLKSNDNNEEMNEIFDIMHL